jgi:hypothetical protein
MGVSKLVRARKEHQRRRRELSFPAQIDNAGCDHENGQRGSLSGKVASGQRFSACPGEVEYGSPTRTCANTGIDRASTAHHHAETVNPSVANPYRIGKFHLRYDVNGERRTGEGENTGKYRRFRRKPNLSPKWRDHPQTANEKQTNASGHLKRIGKEHSRTPQASLPLERLLELR